MMASIPYRRPGNAKSCTCEACVGACLNPGWMSPEDAERAMDAGFATRLMCDWLEPCSQVGNAKRIYVLCPASDHRGGGDAPEIEEFHGYRRGGDFLGSLISSLFSSGPQPYKGRCTFLTAKDRCSIHDSGFKPQQCREAICCAGAEDDPQSDNYDMARLWKTRAGQAAIKRWRALVAESNQRTAA